MPPPVRFHPAARAEIREAPRWYEGEARGLGRAFLGELDATLAFVARHPEMYEAMEADGSVHPALLHRFPYAVIYEVRPDGGAVVLRAGTCASGPRRTGSPAADA